MTDIGAVATIFDDDGRVLLVHQTYKGNKWALPGGAVEPNEAPWDAVVREVKEETGLDVKVVRLASVYQFADRDAVGFHFVCRVVGGDLCVDGGEVSEAAFFDLARLPTPMTKPARQRLADARVASTQPILRVFDRVEMVDEARHGD